MAEDDKPTDDVAELRARGRPAQAAARGRSGRSHCRASAGARAGGGRWSPPSSIVLMAVLAPLSVVARWAHDTVSDTDRYVENVAPLASDPAVQAAVIDRITQEITTRLQVESVTGEAVDALADRGLRRSPPPASRRSRDPLSDAIEGFIEEQVTKLVESDQFETAWIEANRQAHTQMVAVLTGKDTDTVEISDNAVSINLATLIDTVKQRLVDRGFTLAERLPDGRRAVHDLPVRRHHQGADGVPGAQRDQHLAADPGAAVPRSAPSRSVGRAARPDRRRAGAGPVDDRCSAPASTCPARSTSTPSRPTSCRPTPRPPSTTPSSTSSGSTSGPCWSSRWPSRSSPGSRGPRELLPHCAGVRPRAVGKVRQGGDRVGIDTGAFGDRAAHLQDADPVRRARAGAAALRAARPPDGRVTPLVLLVIAGGHPAPGRAAVPSSGGRRRTPRPGNRLHAGPPAQRLTIRSTVGSSETIRPTRAAPTMIAGEADQPGRDRQDDAEGAELVGVRLDVRRHHHGRTPACRATPSDPGEHRAERQPAPADPAEEQQPAGRPPDQAAAATIWKTSRGVADDAGDAVAEPGRRRPPTIWSVTSQPISQQQAPPQPDDPADVRAAPRPARTSAGSPARSWWPRRA